MKKNTYIVLLAIAFIIASCPIYAQFKKRYASEDDCFKAMLNGSNNAYWEYTFYYSSGINTMLYYSMLFACKYQTHSDNCKSIPGTMHRIYKSYDFSTDSITKSIILLFCREGMRRQNPLCASGLFEYYSAQEIDSIKAKEAYYCWQTIRASKGESPENEFEKHWNRDVNHYNWLRKRDGLDSIVKYVPANHKDFDTSIKGCMKSIQEDGNIQAYKCLINTLRPDTANPYPYYECLYYCILMANKYSYEPAFGHVREILLSFYPNQPIEEMDELTQQLIQLYTRPWMEPLPHCPQPSSEKTDMH